jgi:hypothetical protein
MIHDESSNGIGDLIYTVRGMQVMTDRDLARLYEVETKVLNQAVKRNIERFPEQFCFQLSEAEAANWRSEQGLFGDRQILDSRSQFVTLKLQRGKNLKYLPYVFTEQGVAMLSAVLRSGRAVEVSIRIMTAFVEMRKLYSMHSGLIQRLEGIERKQLQHDKHFEMVFSALEKKDSIPVEGVFFDGQVFDAYELASRIIRSAEKNIVLIDNYIDENALRQLSKRKEGVKVFLLSNSKKETLQLDVDKANEQFGGFCLCFFTKSHDRFLIIDGADVYHLGASLKDLGKRWFAFSRLEKSSVNGILSEVRKLIGNSGAT